MLYEESLWYQQTLLALPQSDISPILNVGSSTLHFRTVTQPFIEQNIFAPISKAGCQIYHLDMKAAEGVDIVGDLTDALFQADLQQYGCKLFLCSNLLEHIPSPAREKLCQAMEKMLPENGYLLVSVPYGYPYHKDPIDTMFRPDVAGLSALFPGMRLVKGEIVVAKDNSPKILLKRARGILVNVLHTLFPKRFGLSAAEAEMEKKSIPYWVMPFSVCCVLLQKSKK